MSWVFCDADGNMEGVDGRRVKFERSDRASGDPEPDCVVPGFCEVGEKPSGSRSSVSSSSESDEGSSA
jgi:hypothetical protein